MAIRKEVKGLGMPYDTIYVSGQLSHDDQGNIVAAAPLDNTGTIRDHSVKGRGLASSLSNPPQLARPKVRKLPGFRQKLLGRHPSVAVLLRGK
jgi:hypothetical protein